MSCDYAHNDGAYVLGALSPAERAAYERHLVGCSACRAAVAGLAVLPGLLGRLDAGVAVEVPAHPAPAPSPRLAAMLEAAAAAKRRERRARRWWLAGAALAAACVALPLGVGLGLAGDGAPDNARPSARIQTQTVAMAAMRPISAAARQVTAEVGLTETAAGTEVRLHCAYAAGSPYRGAWTLRLVAYGPDGATEQVGSWRAAPGDEVTFTGITRFVGPDLVRVRLVKGDGAALLDYEVP